MNSNDRYNEIRVLRSSFYSIGNTVCTALDVNEVKNAGGVSKSVALFILGVRNEKNCRRLFAARYSGF